MPFLNAIIVVVTIGVTTVVWRTPMKTYRPWNPDQGQLLPPSPHQWLPEGHLAYFILDVLAEMDLIAITQAVRAKDARGSGSIRRR
jgi:hypothetical protein